MTAIAITIVLVRVVWLFSILFGTAYIVFWLGYSGWWWVLAICLIACAGSDAKVTTSVTSGERR